SSVAAPWLHPRVSQAPREVRRQLEFAGTFSGVMHGAALLYNLMLAERRHFDPLADELGALVTTWADSVDWDAAVLDWEEFWLVASEGNPGIRVPTRTFV